MEIEGRSKVEVRSTCFPDVVVEILSRLPVKSLLRFKCVSKEWQALIKSNYFTAIHLQNSDCDLSLLFKLPQNNHRSIPFLRNESTPRMFLLFPVGSSNGLVCINFNIYVHVGSVEQNIVVWNPATEQFRYHLLPNQRHYHNLIGFEFFHDIRDYKVVIVLQPGTDNTFWAKVFTRSTNSWRDVKTNCSLQGAMRRKAHRDHTITLNGVLYWSLWAEKRSYVAAFNLCNEAFYVIPLPEKINSITALISWKKSLALLAGDEDEELWMMIEEPSAVTTQISWVKQFIVKPSLLEIGILGSWKDEYLLGTDHLVHHKDLHCYDPASQKWIDFHNMLVV